MQLLSLNLLSSFFPHIILSIFNSIPTSYLTELNRIAKLKEARLAAETEIALFRKEQEEKFQQTIKEVTFRRRYQWWNFFF